MGCHHACAFLALLLILGDTHNFLFAEDPVKRVPCVDSGQTVEGTSVMYPADATPTNCTASGPTKGLRCTIGNYKINHPDACKDVTERLQSRAVNATPPRLDEVCQPQLTNLNLYKLACMHTESSPEVSLNFTFELPLCAAEFANASTAVKVDFNANRDHPQNYFHTNPICRLFNYTGSDFSHISDFSQKITMFYEWMAVGIQDRSSYPSVVYYLSLTAYPSAAQLNYTVVYLDVSSQSMRLVAGAWRSNGRAHFIFLPIDHISNYRIEATSVGQTKWEHSEEVSSSTFELKDIPNYANIVTVKVTPADRDVCGRLGYPCAPITITLQDKNTLNLPVEPLHPSVPGVNWRHILVITVGLLVGGVLIVATIAVLRCRRGRPTKPEGYEPAPEAPDEQPEPRQVLTITSLPESLYDKVLLDLLTHHGFKTDPLKDAQCTSRMRYKPILLIIHPHMNNYPEPAPQTFVDLVLYIFENKPLWRRVMVISLEHQGEVCRLQDLFPGFNSNRPRLSEFWTYLEKRTHELPEDGVTLIEQLNEVALVLYEEEASASYISELSRRNSRDFDAEEEEPERVSPIRFHEVHMNMHDRCVPSVSFHQAVPKNEGEGHDLEPHSEVGASGVSTISDPQEPVGQMIVSVEIHSPCHEPSHCAASDEDHHVPQGPHLNPNDENEIYGVPSQRLPPDGSDALSQLLPSLETEKLVNEGRGGFDSRQHVPHLSLLLSSSGSVVSREETENREQVLGASEGRLQGQAAMSPPAVSLFPDTPVGENSIREGEENSYHSESEPRLSGVHQPCYDDRARGDNYHNSANGYSPSPPRVCGPDEYMSMLSQGSLGPPAVSLFPDTPVGENSIREGEENSYHSSLGPSASSLEPEPRLSGVHQPCCGDRARGDNYHSAHGYSPSPPRVCGPDEYMSVLSLGSLGPEGNIVEGRLEEFSAVCAPPASGPAKGEGCRVRDGGEERNGGRSVLSGANAVCGPENHRAFSSIRNSRQGRGDSLSMTRQNGGIDEARNPPQEAVSEGGGVDFDRARQNDGIGINEARNPWLEEAAAWESDDGASGFKVGPEHGNFNIPLTFNVEVPLLPERDGREGEQPMPVAQQRAEGIRYDGHEDEQGERVYEPLFYEDRRDNEQEERSVRGNENMDYNGQIVFIPPAVVFQRGEPEEHAEGIAEEDNLDSGVAFNSDSIESQDSQ